MADTCCDLSKPLLDRYNIRTVPLYVVIDGKPYRDGLDITPQKIYERFNATGRTPSTSATNVADYLDFFRPYAESGTPVVYIGLSEKMSSTVENARQAAAQFPGAEIFCIDSKNLSTGIGLLVIKAAEMAEAGMAAIDIAREIKRLADLSRASFVLERLEYLRAGGRCSSLAALGASLLSIRPEIAVRDGSMSNRSKFIGSIESVARKYARNLLLGKDNIDPARCFVTYTEDTDSAIVAAVAEEAANAGCFREILQTNAGCVITSHCGRNCIGLLFIDKQ